MQVLADVLPFGTHLRIEFEGLEVQLGPDVGRDAREGGFERAQTDGAPGARDIGDEIDLEGGGHGAGLRWDEGSNRPDGRVAISDGGGDRPDFNPSRLQRLLPNGICPRQ